MKLIERTDLLQKMLRVMGTPDIKVISGVRRSGKSKLMESFMEHVRSHIRNANIVHINFNLPDTEPLKEYHALYDYVKNAHQEGCRNILCIDEVQMCQGFEMAINGLHALEIFDIYITGSNAFLLSSDLATLFTGRTFEIKVYPFSFAEFLRYYGYEDKEAAFSRYLTEGGMAGSYLYPDSESKYTYLEEVFRTLVIRDIYDKYKIRNQSLMTKLVEFMMDNVGNLVSSRSLTACLSGAKESVSNKTVGKYIEYFTLAYAFYRFRRYDVRGKKYLGSNDKFYLSDHGFRFAILGTRNMDYGRILENIVAIELLRRGYEVYVGVLYKTEIDFVAMKRKEKIYIQVADSISDSKTFAREVEPLLKIRDAYPKILLARTGYGDYDYEGVQVKNLANWLSEIK